MYNPNAIDKYLVNGKYFSKQRSEEIAREYKAKRSGIQEIKHSEAFLDDVFRPNRHFSKASELFNNLFKK
jgi:hypothetical protein